MNFQNTLDFAQKLDAEDPLASFRHQFYIPVLHGNESIYFTGNSLGLQPKNTQDYVLNELEDWANFGKEARQHGRKPWNSYHDDFPPRLAPLLGARVSEIAVMGQLTENLHRLLATFYRPTKDRYKVIYEENAFPSDLYAITSHVRLAGLEPADALVEVKCLPGEKTVREEDIFKAIDDCGDALALVFMGGVNYLTGQLFDMKSITETAHLAGALCGFDLAHAVGNVPLQLHDWNVDFACWCSYKYLNSGPGGVGGIFVHEQHAGNTSLLRMAGWPGSEKAGRLETRTVFEPAPTAEGWFVSGAPILNMAAHMAALEIFFKANFKRVLAKSELLSSYLMFVINESQKGRGSESLHIITPAAAGRHGSQVSFRITGSTEHFQEKMRMNGIITDAFKPDIIRIAPVPLYNTFEEVFTFGQVLSGLLR